MHPPPPPFASLFCFVWARLQPRLGGFPGPGSRSCSRSSPVPGGHRSALRTGRRTGSSMELWGAYLLLCLFSLLPQATTEPPSPNVKKSAGVKKGKEGDGPLCLPGSWSSGSFPLWTSPEN